MKTGIFSFVIAIIALVLSITSVVFLYNARQPIELPPVVIATAPSSLVIDKRMTATSKNNNDFTFAVRATIEFDEWTKCKLHEEFKSSNELLAFIESRVSYTLLIEMAKRNKPNAKLNQDIIDHFNKLGYSDLWIMTSIILEPR